MRAVVYFSFGVSLVFSVVTSAVTIDESWVRVRLFENMKKVTIHGKRIELVKKPDSIRNVSEAENSNKLLSIEFKRKWGQSFLFLSNDRSSSELKSQSVFVKGEEIKIDSQFVSEFLQIYKRDQGFDVIAYVKLRDYLRGVVSSEVPLTWPAETLKAQIVAARSYVLYMSEQRKKLAFDVESSIKDQVYKHTKANRLESLLNETANIVLFDQNKKLFKAYYHSECGGQTSSAKRVFGDSQFDVEVRDPYCQGRTWRLSISKEEIENYFGVFRQFVNSFSPVKRAYALTVEKNDQTFEQWDAQKLRMKIGSTRLKSTWFETRAVGKHIEFVGKGYGHGVGLCQWGSRQMGIMKKNFREILSFYYPGTLIKVVTNERLI